LVPAMQQSGNATLLMIAAFASVAINIARKALETKEASGGVEPRPAARSNSCLWSWHHVV
jgi:hypothetical protein